MTAAKEYAKALFSLSIELSRTEEVYSDIGICKEAVKRDGTYTRIIDSPALPTEEKLALIDKAFASVDENLLSLLKILCERRAFHLLPKICDELEELYFEHRGICRAEVISAHPLSPSQLERLKAKISALTGKSIILKNTTDPQLLGGVKLRYDGIQLDGSLKARLNEIENRLRNTVL